MAQDEKVIAVEFTVTVSVGVPLTLHRHRIAAENARTRLEQIAPGLFQHRDVKVSSPHGFLKTGTRKVS